MELKAVITAEDKASSVMAAFGSKANSTLVGLGSAFAKYGTIAVGALSAAGGVALKSASDMQMLRSNLDTLTGSAETGAKVFKDLNKFAAATPFETTDLASATKTMLSFGITSDQAMKNLKMLGDVSLGNKEKLSGLTLAFSQVQSTGRLMGQDLLQMINQGFNPLTIISQQTGKSMATLKDEMAAGSISADMVTKAFETATSQGGLFYKGMEKGSLTMEGRMSTLKDNIGMAARAMVGLSDTGDVVKGGLFDKVSNSINTLISYLERNKEKINEVASAFMDKFAAAVMKAIEIITSIVGYLMQHKDLLTWLGFIVGTILVAAFGAWAVSVIAATWPILAIGVAIGSIAFAIKKVIDYWPQITAFFGGVWNSIKNAFSSVYEAIKSPFEKAFNWIKNAFKSVINGYISGLNLVIRGINKVPGVKIAQIPMLAQGGFLNAGQAAIVGERGPELFVPSSSGNVIPNNKLGGNISINIYGNISTQNGTQDIENLASRLGYMLENSAVGI